MNMVLKRVAALAMLLAISIMIPACNTVKGAGKDIEQGAEATERAIDKATSKK